MEVSDPQLQTLHQQRCHRKRVYLQIPPPHPDEGKVGFRGPGVESGLRQSPGAKLRSRVRPMDPLQWQAAKTYQRWDPGGRKQEESRGTTQRGAGMHLKRGLEVWGPDIVHLSGLHCLEGPWDCSGDASKHCVSTFCLKLSWTSAPSTTVRLAFMTVTSLSGPSASTWEARPTPAPVCQASLGMAEPAKVRGHSDFPPCVT